MLNGFQTQMLLDHNSQLPSPGRERGNEVRFLLSTVQQKVDTRGALRKLDLAIEASSLPFFTAHRRRVHETSGLESREA